MKASDTTVTVNVVVELDGTPITHMIHASASIRPIGDTGPNGRELHVQLDGRELARALLPELLATLRQDAAVRAHLATFNRKPPAKDMLA